MSSLLVGNWVHSQDLLDEKVKIAQLANRIIVEFGVVVDEAIELALKL